MVLIDTSVWIQHLHKAQPDLVSLLAADQVVRHAMVQGELACGRLADRAQFLESLAALPLAPSCEDSEVMHFIERRRLFGSGIGWIDAHLLAAALTQGLGLWTLDAKLRAAAVRVGVRRA